MKTLSKRFTVVVGASRNWNRFGFDTTALDALGMRLAARGDTVITGSSPGLPHFVAEGAFRAGGRVLGYSPACNRLEHVREFASPVAGFSRLLYCGRGLIDRELKMIRRANLVVVLDGNLGTLSELIIALKERKEIIMAKESKVIWATWMRIARSLEVYQSSHIVRLPLKEIAKDQ